MVKILSNNLSLIVYEGGVKIQGQLLLNGISLPYQDTIWAVAAFDLNKGEWELEPLPGAVWLLQPKQ